jgi:uncharacterized membrane protein YfcA
MLTGSLFVVVTVGLFVLGTISGMVGLGVSFAALPFLGLFLPDLTHQVQPLSLALNGVTAAFVTCGFARSGLVEWKRAIPLAGVTTAAAPIGSYAAHFIPQIHIWYLYFAAVLYLAYRLFKPGTQQGKHLNFSLALLLAVPIAVCAGLLGVGPGFLLMPTLILVGFEAKRAAGINAFAVTLPSFSALVPHISTARFDPILTVSLMLAGAIGAFLGARITSLYLPGVRVKQIFGVLIVVMTLYKIYTLLT